MEEHAALVAALDAHDADAAAILAAHLRPIREIVAKLPAEHGDR